MRRASLALLLAFAPIAAAQSAAPVQPTGAIAGTVRDEGGRPVPEAVITVDRTARQVRSDTAGRFLIERVPAGIQDLSIRRVGFLPARAELNVIADSATVISVTLVSAAQRLRAVRVEEQLFNQLGGVVIDERGAPVAGAEVDIVGLRRSMVTDTDGRFLFVDLAPGNYMLEVRKEGFRLGRRGVEMVARIERDFAIRLYAGEDLRMSVELARVVAHEADLRQSMAGVLARVVNRAELERWDEAPLAVALAGSSGALTMNAPRPGRLGKSLDPRGTAGSQFGMDAREGASCVLINGYELMSGPALQHFRANEVERVEIFPPGTDRSRTLCSRFPPSSGCACPPETGGIVIWLK